MESVADDIAGVSSRPSVDEEDEEAVETVKDTEDVVVEDIEPKERALDDIITQYKQLDFP
jgi:hypothetical protein